MREATDATSVATADARVLAIGNLSTAQTEAQLQAFQVILHSFYDSLIALQMAKPEITVTIYT